MASQKRLQRELEKLLRQPPEGIAVQEPVTAPNEWVIALSYESTPSLYQGQRFYLRFRFGDKYPMESPEVIFVGTVPLHEHIYSNGHICMDILYDAWSPAMTVSTVTQSIFSMLAGATRESYRKPEDDEVYTRRCRETGQSPKQTAAHAAMASPAPAAGGGDGLPLPTAVRGRDTHMMLQCIMQRVEGLQQALEDGSRRRREVEETMQLRIAELEAQRSADAEVLQAATQRIEALAAAAEDGAGRRLTTEREIKGLQDAVAAVRDVDASRAATGASVEKRLADVEVLQKNLQQRQAEAMGAHDEQEQRLAQQMGRVVANVQSVLDMAAGSLSGSGAPVISGRLERLESAVQAQKGLQERMAVVEAGVRGVRDTQAEQERRVAVVEGGARGAEREDLRHEVRVEVKNAQQSVLRRLDDVDRVMRAHDLEGAGGRLAQVDRLLRTHDLDRMAARLDDIDSVVNELRHSSKANAAPAKAMKLKLEQIEREGREVQLSRAQETDAVETRLDALERQLQDGSSRRKVSGENNLDTTSAQAVRGFERRLERVEGVLSAKVNSVEGDVAARIDETADLAAAVKEQNAALRGTERRLRTLEGTTSGLAARVDNCVDAAVDREAKQTAALREITRTTKTIEGRTQELADANNALRAQLDRMDTSGDQQQRLSALASKCAALDASLATVCAQTSESRSALDQVHKAAATAVALEATVAGMQRDGERIASRVAACEAGAKEVRALVDGHVQDSGARCLSLERRMRDVEGRAEGSRFDDHDEDTVRRLERQVASLARGVGSGGVSEPAASPCDRLRRLERQMDDVSREAAGRQATADRRMDDIERAAAAVRQTVTALEARSSGDALTRLQLEVSTLDARHTALDKRVDTGIATAATARDVADCRDAVDTVRRRVDVAEKAARDIEAQTDGKVDECVRATQRQEREMRHALQQLKDDCEHARAAGVQQHEGLQRQLADARSDIDKGVGAARRQDALAARVESLEMSAGHAAKRGGSADDDSRNTLLSRAMAQLDELLGRSERAEESRRRCEADCARMAAELRDIAEKMRSSQLSQSNSLARAEAQWAEVERQVDQVRHAATRKGDPVPALASRIDALERSVDESQATLTRQAADIVKARNVGNESMTRVLAQLDEMGVKAERLDDHCKVRDRVAENVRVLTEKVSVIEHGGHSYAPPLRRVDAGGLDYEEVRRLQSAVDRLERRVDESVAEIDRRVDRKVDAVVRVDARDNLNARGDGRVAEKLRRLEKSLLDIKDETMASLLDVVEKRLDERERRYAGGREADHADGDIIAKLHALEMSMLEIREMSNVSQAARLGDIEASVVGLKSMQGRLVTLERLVGAPDRPARVSPRRDRDRPTHGALDAVLERLERLEQSMYKPRHAASMCDPGTADESKLELAQLQARIQGVVGGSSQPTSDSVLDRLDAAASGVAELQFALSQQAAEQSSRMAAVERALGPDALPGCAERSHDGGLAGLVLRARNESAEAKRCLEVLTAKMARFEDACRRLEDLERHVTGPLTDIAEAGAARMEEMRVQVDALCSREVEASDHARGRLEALERTVGDSDSDTSLAAAVGATLGKAGDAARRIEKLDRTMAERTARHAVRMEVLEQTVGDVAALYTSGASAVPTGTSLADVAAAAARQTAAVEEKLTRAEAAMAKTADDNALVVARVERTVFGADADGTSARFPPASLPPGGLFEQISTALASTDAFHTRIHSLEASSAAAHTHSTARLDAIEAIVGGAGMTPPADGLVGMADACTSQLAERTRTLDKVERRCRKHAPRRDARLEVLERSVGEPSGCPGDVTESLYDTVHRNRRLLDDAALRVVRIEEMCSVQDAAHEGRLSALERAVGVGAPCTSSGATTPAPQTSGLLYDVEAVKQAAGAVAARVDMVEARVQHTSAGDGGRIDRLELAVGPAARQSVSVSPKRPGRSGTRSPPRTPCRLTSLADRVGELERRADEAQHAGCTMEKALVDVRGLVHVSGVESLARLCDAEKELRAAEGRLAVRVAAVEDGVRVRTQQVDDIIANLRRDFAASERTLRDVEAGVAQSTPLRPVLEAMVTKVEELIGIEREVRRVGEGTLRLERAVAGVTDEWGSKRRALDTVIARVEQLVALERTVHDCVDTCGVLKQRVEDITLAADTRREVPAGMQGWMAKFESQYDGRFKALAKTLQLENARCGDALGDKVAAATATAHLAYEKASHADSLNAQDFTAIKSLVTTIEADKKALQRPVETLTARVDAIAQKLHAADTAISVVESQLRDVRSSDIPPLVERTKELAVSSSKHAVALTDMRLAVDKVSDRIAAVQSLASTVDERLQLSATDTVLGRLISVEDSVRQLKANHRDDHDKNVKTRSELSGMYSELKRQRASLVNLSTQLEGRP